MRNLWTLSLLLLAFHSNAGTRRYSVTMSSNPAGQQMVTTDGDQVKVEFEYNDRGRGPKLLTEYRLGSDGIPTSTEITGHDYLKGAVHETFAHTEGRAEWKSASEQGNTQNTTPAFYLGINSPPEELALLARALLASPNGTLALLPEGQASLEKVGDLQVSAGQETKTISHYAIAGLGLVPLRIWLEADGTFFASASNWFAVVREGWDSVVPQLIEAQDAADAARFVELGKSLGRKPSGALAFTGVTLFDSETATAKSGMTVLIQGARIQAVGPDGSVELPVGTEVVEAKGKTLIPGLWDMHVHITSLEEGLLNLAAGVTSVRDLANDTQGLLELRRKFDEGVAIGPRILMAGFLDGPGPYQGPTKVLADTPEEAQAAVDQYAKLGYGQMKLYSSLKPELVPGIIARAHGHKMRVSGHIPATMTADQCVRLGFDEIHHTNFLFLNFWAKEVPDTRTPARFTEVAERAADLDLQSQPVQDFLKLLKEHDTVIDPTVAIFEGMFTARPGSLDPAFAAIASRLPPQVRRGFLAGGLPVPEGKDQRYRDSFKAMLNLIKLLHDNGIRIVAGTDNFAGFTLHRELELYVQAGIPSSKVLQLATLGAAQVMGRDQELGSIAPGKLADLVLIEGEPLWNIPDIRKVEWTVKNGVLYRSADLYKALGIAP